MSTISYPETPAGVSRLDQYLTLSENWAYSRHMLQQMNVTLSRQLGDRPISIVVAGSLGRMEACRFSDLDYMLLVDKKEDDVDQIRDTISRLASELGLRLPNECGVFSEVIPVPYLLGQIGAKDESLPSVAQRLLLLMESKPIFNEGIYQATVKQMLTKYLEYVIQDSNKEAVFLLNDIIRYFRGICVNYQFNVWKEEDKWVMRNVKLRHSRLIMYAGLLLVVLNSSIHKDDKIGYISQQIPLTPLERITQVYREHNDDSFERVLAMYDIFLRKMGDPSVRDQLRIGYEDRYTNPHYAELKTNSDNLQTELTRFIFSRKGVWPDQVFEYLIF